MMINTLHLLFSSVVIPLAVIMCARFISADSYPGRYDAEPCGVAD